MDGIIFEVLKDFPSWIFFKTEAHPKIKNKLVKIPYSSVRPDRKASTIDPHAWSTLASARGNFEGSGCDGFGFVLNQKDDIFCIDLDDALDASGDWKPHVHEIIKMFPGAAVELSISGKGLHIWSWCPDLPQTHRCKNTALGIEMYTKERFIAINPDQSQTVGSFNMATREMLDGFIETFLSSAAEGIVDTNYSLSEVTNPDWIGPEDDDELIRRALNAKPSAQVAFSGKASFKDIWTCESVVADFFNGDDSAADLALANHLSFWTGGNTKRMHRIMMRDDCPLRRSKWYEREDYYLIGQTIQKASRDVTSCYKDPTVRTSVTPEELKTAITVEPVISYNDKFMNVEAQVEFFKGCVYVEEEDAVLTPYGCYLNNSQFNTMYGGYDFEVSPKPQAKPTNKAWDAFTKNHIVSFPKVHTGMFRPDMAPGHIFKEDGLTAVNRYVPFCPDTANGDPKPFLDHVAKLLPDSNDQMILLSYLAALVQHKGYKFAWAPVLQGVEGNGKTLINDIAAYAIGEKFTHRASASNLSEKYNDWIANNLLILVEDFHAVQAGASIGGGGALINKLRPMITNRRIAIRAMQQSEKTTYNYANFIFNTNYKDALHKTSEDRRFCVFFTAQQTFEDLERDGMSGAYFVDLFNWLDKKKGYAIIANFLLNFDIPVELNPAGECRRAPPTSMIEEVKEQSLGLIEQEIMQAVDEERIGFRGGFICLYELDIYLKDKLGSRSMSPNKKSIMLRNMGFIKHPDVERSRFRSNLPHHRNSKVVLYFKRGHKCLDIRGEGAAHSIFHEYAQFNSIGFD